MFFFVFCLFGDGPGILNHVSTCLKNMPGIRLAPVLFRHHRPCMRLNLMTRTESDNHLSRPLR
jgi:hypothetical protein